MAWRPKAGATRCAHCFLAHYATFFCTVQNALSAYQICCSAARAAITSPPRTSSLEQTQFVRREGHSTPTVTQRTLIIMPSNPRKHNDRAKDDRNGRHNAETAAAAVLLDIDEDPKLEVTNSIDAVAHSSGAGAARHTTQRWQHLNAVRQSIWSNDMRSEQV